MQNIFSLGAQFHLFGCLEILEIATNCPDSVTEVQPIGPDESPIRVARTELKFLSAKNSHKKLQEKFLNSKKILKKFLKPEKMLKNSRTTLGARKLFKNKSRKIPSAQ